MTIIRRGRIGVIPVGARFWRFCEPSEIMTEHTDRSDDGRDLQWEEENSNKFRIIGEGLHACGGYSHMAGCTAHMGLAHFVCVRECESNCMLRAFHDGECEVKQENDVSPKPVEANESKRKAGHADDCPGGWCDGGC